MPLSTTIPIDRNGVLTAFSNPASAGTNLLLASPEAGAKIRIVSILAIASAANTAEFKSGTTAVSAVFPLGANGGFALEHNDVGWFETNAGENLNVTLGGAISVAVQFNYIVYI